jgi:hypothetical protein
MEKTPEQFQLGDILVHNPGVPYTGSAVTSVKPFGPFQTQVEFANGEIVEFFNGIQHQVQDS